jgi:hypothetical protein
LGLDDGEVGVGVGGGLDGELDWVVVVVAVVGEGLDWVDDIVVVIVVEVVVVGAREHIRILNDAWLCGVLDDGWLCVDGKLDGLGLGREGILDGLSWIGIPYRSWRYTGYIVKTWLREVVWVLNQRVGWLI